MPYELNITEVGPAEYPLIEVLRETIFAELGHRSFRTIADKLAGQRDVLALVAHLEGNPVGFKVGHGEGPAVFHSRDGGVLKEYRRLGLARRMQQWQHGFARSRGYKHVYFNTFTHFKDMMRFGLASGFVPVAAEWRELRVMSFKFVRNLTLSDPPPSTGIGRDGGDDVEATIEPTRCGDADAVAQVVNRCGGQPATTAQVAAELAAPDAITLAARVGGRLSGCALAYGTDAARQVFTVRRLAVRDEDGGEDPKSRAIGVALLRRLIEAARGLGHATIRWDVPNHDARNLQLALEVQFDFAGIVHDPNADGAVVVLQRGTV